MISIHPTVHFPMKRGPTSSIFWWAKCLRPKYFMRISYTTRMLLLRSIQVLIIEVVNVSTSIRVPHPSAYNYENYYNLRLLLGVCSVLNCVNLINGQYFLGWKVWCGVIVKLDHHQSLHSPYSILLMRLWEIKFIIYM